MEIPRKAAAIRRHLDAQGVPDGWRWYRTDNESNAKDDPRIKTNIPI